ncbi:MAG TPA: DsbA family protein, partial [Acidimicrobiia bacterium]|nr:DsbA family protein [Acidimicrobiia bacterium]
VTFDYRCPFARNAHEAVVAAQREHVVRGIEWRYQAFSLDQVHLAEGDVPVWDREPDEWGTGVLALLYGLAVRDAFADRFLDAHVALFAARHDEGLRLDDEAVLRDTVASVGLDAGAVSDEVWSGRPLKTLAAEHTQAADDFDVFGVPTFIEGDEAVFIRFMDRGRVDDLERAMELLDWTRFNEFKRTRLPR